MDESCYYNTQDRDDYQERPVVRRETSAYKRRNNPNADKILRTHTMGTNARLDRLNHHLLSSRQEYAFSPVNNCEASVIGFKEPQQHVSSKRPIDMQPKVIQVSESPTVDSVEPKPMVTRSKSMDNRRKRNDESSFESCQAVPWQQTNQLDKTNDDRDADANSKQVENKPPKAKIRHNQSLNFKNSKSDVVVRNLSSDEDEDDELSDVDLNSSLHRGNAYQDDNDDDDDEDDFIEKKQLQTAIHPMTEQMPNRESSKTVKTKGKKTTNESERPVIDDHLPTHSSIYELLVDNTIKFVLQQPSCNHTVKCFIWRGKKLFHEYTMYVETVNPYTNKVDAIPILIARKKKATAKIFVRIAALSVRQNLLENYKRYDLGKLKSKNLISFKKHQYVLTGSKQNPLKSLKTSELSGNLPNKGSTQNLHKDLVLSFSESVSNFASMPKKNKEEILKVNYEGYLFKASQPSQIKISILAPSDINDFEIAMSNHNPRADDLEYPFKLINKQPEYDSLRKQYLLDFKKRVNLPSVNNFQIVFENDVNTVIMQVGKAEKNYYICDYTYPLNAFQAFSIAITKLLTKNA